MFWVIVALYIASTVIGELLRPKQSFSAPKAGSVDDFAIPTADNGRPIPIVYGTVKVTGPNVLWYGSFSSKPVTDNVKTGYFSSDTITYGYKYGLSMVLGICHGPVEIVKVQKDDKQIGGVRRPSGYANIWGKDNATETSEYMVYELDEPEDKGAGFGGSDGGYNPLVFFSKGTQTDIFPTLTKSDMGLSEHSGWKGLVYACFHNFNFGGNTVTPNISFIVKKLPNPFSQAANIYVINEQSNYEGDADWNTSANANPILVIYDILTNNQYGLGLPTSLIDEDSFKAAAITSASEKIGISVIIQQNQTVNNFILEMLRYVDGVLYTRVTDGKVYVKLIRNDYIIDDLTLLNDSNISNCEITRNSWQDTFNTVKVNYNRFVLYRGDNAQFFYTNAIAQAQDLANYQSRGGEIVSTTIDYLACTDPDEANLLAERALRMLSYPFSKISIECNRTAWNLNPGDAFKLTWPPLGIVNMVCRVVNINYGNLLNGRITIEATEDVFNVNQTTYISPQTSDWVNPVEDLQIITEQKLVEMPLELTNPGQFLTDGGVWSGGNGERRYLMSLAGRSSAQELGYDVQSDTTGGTSFLLTNIVNIYTPYGKLYGEYGRNVDMTLDTVGFYIKNTVDVQNVKSISAGQELTTFINLALIDDEIISFRTITQQIDGSFLISNVVRGIFDTIPQHHNNNSTIYFISYGFGKVQSNEYLRIFSGSTELFPNINVKLLPFNSKQKFPIASATAINKTLGLRAWAPYPPGHVMVNSISFPYATMGNKATIIYRKRDRILQNNQQLIVAQSAGDIEETSTKTYENNYYGLKIYIGGILIRTIDMTSIESFDYTISDRYADDPDFGKQITFKIWSESNNGKSVDRDIDFTMTGLGMPLGMFLGGIEA